MTKNDKLLLKTLAGEQVFRSPIWLMRQAGRYLPEYRDLRAQADDFLSFCLHPEWAAEATLQPVRRFGLDAAILFADILLVPYGLGRSLSFIEGRGPILESVTEEKDLGTFIWDIERLEPVFETIQNVCEQLPEETALIGFAGSPWTIACYMIEGKSTKGFPKALSVAQNDPSFLSYLFEEIYQATVEYLARQIESGVEIVQLFDSHAGLLQGELFRQWVIEPTKRLVTALKTEYPEIPIIGFPRGARKDQYRIYAEETGVTALSIDQKITLEEAKALQTTNLLQGNLDPEILLRGGKEMKRAAESIMETLGPNHIFNLGHGVLPQTPPENVFDLVAFVKRIQG